MWLAHQLVRFVVVQEAFMDRIPSHRSVEAIADDAQVAHNRTVMADFRRADAILMLADAIEEIVVVVAAFIETNVIRAPFRPYEFLRLRV